MSWRCRWASRSRLGRDMDCRVSGSVRAVTRLAVLFVDWTRVLQVKCLRCSSWVRVSMLLCGSARTGNMKSRRGSEEITQSSIGRCLKYALKIGMRIIRKEGYIHELFYFVVLVVIDDTRILTQVTPEVPSSSHIPTTSRVQR